MLDGGSDIRFRDFVGAAKPRLPRWRRVATVWGLSIVILTATPGLVYFSHQVSDEYRPLVFADVPGANAVRSAEIPGEPDERHLPTPKFVKGIYVTADMAGERQRFQQLVDLVKRTELNALVIDVKNQASAIAFNTTDARLTPYLAKRPPMGDLPEFTARLHREGIYLIGRVFVFQDQTFAGQHLDLATRRLGGGYWRDNLGQLWLDPAAKEVWKYNVLVAKAAYDGGFDEIQFDYVRFPSDGALKALAYPVWDGVKPKATVMREFFTYLDHELRVLDRVPTSVDLFGLTMWQHDSDLNIGQRLDAAATRFNFISPMVYPSHYPNGFENFANPAEYPYRIVYDNLVRGQAVFARLKVEAAANPGPAGADAPPLATVRPWIQDFDMGAIYDAFMVREQMRAAVDGGASGWLLWNAANVYTVGALEKE